MLYEDLKFPQIEGRPFFYSNFVTTLDGKVKVCKKGYWPIGSRRDYETLLELRAYADVLIHGKKTVGGSRTLSSISTPEFEKMRQDIGKDQPLIYLVISAHPDDSLIEVLRDERDIKHILATTDEAVISPELEKIVEVVRLGPEKADIKRLSEFLFSKGFKDILVEGGPHVMGGFYEEDLIDELFLTISPKVLGSDESAITMVEGLLLPPDKIRQFKIMSVKQVEDELFLRYQINRSDE